MTTYAATPIVAITRKTNAVPAISPAASHATVATSAPASPPRSAETTLSAIRWRRVSVEEGAVWTVMRALLTLLRRARLRTPVLGQVRVLEEQDVVVDARERDRVPHF